MTSLDFLVVGTAIAPLALLAAGSLWIWQSKPTPYRPPAPKPDSWGDHPEDALWEEAAGEMRLGALSRTRIAAEKWGQVVAALVAVFGAVSFVKGPDVIPGLSSAKGSIAVGLLALAGLEVLVATLLAGIAAHGIPQATSQLDGYVLKQWSRAQAVRARRLLRWSRFLGLAGGVTVLFGGIFVSVAHLQSSATVNGEVYVVIGPSGVGCGPLQLGAGTPPVLSIDGVPLINAVQVEKVSTCPEKISS